MLFDLNEAELKIIIRDVDSLRDSCVMFGDKDWMTEEVKETFRNDIKIREELLNVLNINTLDFDKKQLKLIIHDLSLTKDNYSVLEKDSRISEVKKIFNDYIKERKNLIKKLKNK